MPADSSCGSGLAREDGVPVNIYVSDTPHSRASPLPQGLTLQAFPRTFIKAAIHQVRRTEKLSGPQKDATYLFADSGGPMSHPQDPATPQAVDNPNDDGFVLGTAGRDLSLIHI